MDPDIYDALTVVFTGFAIGVGVLLVIFTVIWLALRHGEKWTKIVRDFRAQRWRLILTSSLVIVGAMGITVGAELLSNRPGGFLGLTSQPQVDTVLQSIANGMEAYRQRYGAYDANDPADRFARFPKAGDDPFDVPYLHLHCGPGAYTYSLVSVSPSRFYVAATPHDHSAPTVSINEMGMIIQMTSSAPGAAPPGRTGKDKFLGGIQQVLNLLLMAGVISSMILTYVESRRKRKTRILGKPVLQEMQPDKGAAT